VSQYVFGPVPSRRLGRSLGVDLVPFKTCSFDCLYCQLGRTTEKTVVRKPWVPIDEVVDAVREHCEEEPDCITLSGSGEPTLHLGMGELIERIKTITNIPLVVLTNGSLLWQEELRRELADADLIIPSLDAGSEACFRQVNRPHNDITFERLLEGLLRLRESYRGRYWLEVFLLDGLNTSDDEMGRFAQIVDRIRPDRVQLNTVSRPPAENTAVAVPPALLQSLAARFSPPAEVIASHREFSPSKPQKFNREDILHLLRRRPCTLIDIANGLKYHPAELSKIMEKMLSDGRVAQNTEGDRRFYRATR